MKLTLPPGLAIGAGAPWLQVRRRVAQPRLRLVCFPYAGGAESVFRNWAAGFAPDVEVAAVCYPGRAPRRAEMPMTSVGAMLDSMLPALLELCDRPFAFFGHSMGALMAYEMTRLLRRLGLPQPACLLLSACCAPPFTRLAENPLHALPRNRLITELRRMGGTPEQVLASEPYMNHILPAIRADFEAIETWTHVAERPLTMPIQVFAGLTDKRVRVTEMFDWRIATSGKFSLSLFEGGHFFLHEHEARLRAEIDIALSAIHPASFNSLVNA